MSASPAGAPAGSTPTGGVSGIMRKRPAASAFLTKKSKAPVKKQAPAPPKPQTAHAPNSLNGAPRPPMPGPGQQMQMNGFSSAPVQAMPQQSTDYNDYRLVTTRRSLTQNLRHHAMKLQTKPDASGQPVAINPYDPTQFTPPVRLHRRYPRDKQQNADLSDIGSGLDDKEREALSVKRAERQAEREANQALIAPSMSDAKKVQRNKNQKKVQDVYYDDRNPASQKKMRLRYEEGRPWHLEDFDGKNVWVGSYEEPLSETNVMLVVEQGGFRMVPVEKWYKFQQTGKVAAMDIEEVEKHMAKKFKDPRWFLNTQAGNEEARRQALMEARAMQRRKQSDDNDVKFNDGPREFDADVDEIDFEHNDEFQDDDEGMLFGPENDEEAKDAEQRIRKEQREANIFGGLYQEDKDWDAEEAKEKIEIREEKKKRKKTNKLLVKKERKYEYESDSDHPYSESSDTEDSEDERERLEEERKKKEEEARKVANGGDKSGASSKGTNTPTGRSEKKALDSRSGLGASLKRPGSPNLSDASGNESSRKKAKTNGTSSRAMSPSVPGGARSLSPEAAKRRPDSGSDTDTSSARQGRPKKQKHSLPGSPQNGSRAGSPTASRPSSPPPSRLPTADEVRAVIPPEGITIPKLVAKFKGRMTKESQPAFIAVVKTVARADKVSGLMVLK